jgi:hypothetical protein
MKVLSTELETAAKMYESLDTVLIMEQYETIKNYQDSFAIFPEVSLDNRLINYKYLGKDYKTFFRGHPLTTRELDYTRRQIRDLAYDISEYQLEEQEVITYFAQEKRSVKKLVERMNYNRELIQDGMAEFLVKQPQIEVFWDSLSMTGK